MHLAGFQCNIKGLTRRWNRNKAKTKEMDMLQGRLAGKLIVFALPVACSSILQQLLIRQMLPLLDSLPGIMRSLRLEAAWR